MLHMERLSTPNKFRPVGLLVGLGAVALTAGCATGSYEINARAPAHVVSESTSEAYVTADQAGGYSHFETIYHFVLQQCDRDDAAQVDKDGCIVLSTEVDQKTYEEFAPGDDVVFSSPLRGYPVSGK
jgi:hypothetical protein